MNTKKVLKFLGITFLITWGALLTRAVLSNMDIITPYNIVGLLLYGIGVLGPSIATYFCLDERSPKGFLNLLFTHKKGTVKYLIILSVLHCLTFYISTFKLAEGYPIYLAPVVCLVMMFFGGCNEEVGWCGILYRELVKKFNIIVTTIISLLIWFSWHLPLFITKGDMHVDMSIVTFFLFLVNIALMKTALMIRTDSPFYCGMIHAISNTASAVFAYEQNTVMVVATVIVWIISVVLWYFPKEKDNDNNANQDQLKIETPEIPVPQQTIETQQNEVEELI